MIDIIDLIYFYAITFTVLLASHNRVLTMNVRVCPFMVLPSNILFKQDGWILKREWDLYIVELIVLSKTNNTAIVA